MNATSASRSSYVATVILVVLLALVACVPGLVVRWKIVETLDTFDRSVSPTPNHALPTLWKPVRPIDRR